MMFFFCGNNTRSQRITSRLFNCTRKSHKRNTLLSSMSNLDEEQMCMELENMIRLGKNAQGIYSLKDLDPNVVVDDYRTTLLHLSIKYDKLEMTNYLIQSKCNLDAQDGHGDTPLILALYNNRITHVLALLKANADASIANDIGESALQVIFGNKYIDCSYVIKFIALNVIEMRFSNEKLARILLRWECPIYYAFYFRNIEVMSTMIEKSYDINAYHLKTGETALHKAVDHYDVEMITFLLKHGADVNIADWQGRTPFDRSIVRHSNVNSKMMKLLMPDKIEWNEQCNANDGKLKLYWVFWEGNKVAMQLFLENYDIDLKVKDAKGNTPLHYLAKNSNWEVFEAIKNKKFDVNAVNDCGETALNISILRRAPIFVLQFLLENGANVNTIVKSNITPMYLACDMDPSEYRREIVSLLLEFGADITLDMRYTTFLHFLVNTVNIETLELFQTAKFDLDVLDRCNETALHLSARIGSAEIVQWLLCKGADINKTSIRGYTPIFEVFSQKNNELERLKCVAILLICGAQLRSEYKTRFVDDDFVEFTVIDEATENGTLSLVSPILAHLAILSVLGQPIDILIVHQINENDQLRNQFIDYKCWLEKTRIETVSKNISLFRILTDTTDKITNYARPDFLFKKTLDMYGPDIDLYFKLKLESCYSLAQKITELREEASYVISESIGLFDTNHIITNKIVSFLKYEDLKIFA